MSENNAIGPLGAAALADKLRAAMANPGVATVERVYSPPDFEAAAKAEMGGFETLRNGHNPVADIMAELESRVRLEMARRDAVEEGLRKQVKQGEELVCWFSDRQIALIEYQNSTFWRAAAVIAALLVALIWSNAWRLP